MATPSTSINPRSDRGYAVLDWGRTRYDDALARQHRLVDERLSGTIADTLVLTEHEPVITGGRGAHAANLVDPSATVVPVERGGDVTWHGPGQIVGYPIRLLPPDGRDLGAHLRAIESLLLDVLASFRIAALRVSGKTGVWVEIGGAPRKIASIGIAARRWCTYHGFALNVDCDLDAFRAIHPCGFDAAVMTSMTQVLGASPSMEAVREAIRRTASPTPA